MFKETVSSSIYRVAVCLFLSMSGLLVSGSIQAADDPVKAFAERVASSRVSFSYSYEMEDRDVTLTGGGNIVVQGESYRMTGDGLDIWCDGKSICTEDTAAREVVIEPVWAGSGAFVNPAALVRNIGSEFSWDTPGHQAVFNGRQTVRYDLSPKTAGADISEMSLYFSPDGITLVGAELWTVKVRIVFHLSEMEFSTPEDETEFAIPSFSPEYFVTDLR